MFKHITGSRDGYILHQGMPQSTSLTGAMYARLEWRMLVWLAAVAIAWALCSSEVLAATYYVDATGGDDGATGLTSLQAWKTIAKINSSSFAPGDSILFKRGEVWREQLYVPSSGSSDNPITLDAYDSGAKPIITAADTAFGVPGDWTDQGGNVWARPFATETRVVLFNASDIGTRAASAGAISTDHEWFWEAGTLYLYAQANPTSYYSAVEAGVRESAIDLNDASHITVRNLELQGANPIHNISPGGCVYVDENADSVVIEDNTIRYCYGHGVRIQGASRVRVSHNAISDITANGNVTLGDGVEVKDVWLVADTRPIDITIEDNTIGGRIDRQGIAILDVDTITIEGNTVTAGSAGIDLEPNVGGNHCIIDALVTNNTVSKNTGVGISVSSSGVGASNITLSENTINLNDGASTVGIVGFHEYLQVAIERNTILNVNEGIQMAYSPIATIERNYIKAGATNHFAGLHGYYDAHVQARFNIVDGFTAAIRMWSNGSYPSTIGVFENNVLFAPGNYCIFTDARSATTARNNTCQSAGTDMINVLLYDTVGAEQDIDVGIYFAPNDPTPLYRYFSTYHNLVDWRTVSGHDEHSFDVDPQFRNVSGSFASTSDFAYNSTSPAIDAGTTTTAITATTTDFYGNPIYGTPDIGAIEYQPPYTMGTDSIPTTGSVRLYADGTYRQRTATSSMATSSLSVAPQSGWGSGEYAHYMDIAITSWSTTKEWIATSTSAGNTSFTLTDLTPNAWYEVAVDTATGTNITGSACTGGTCQANGSGTLSFTYTGTWSTHTFTVSEGEPPAEEDPPPLPTGGGGGGSARSRDTVTPKDGAINVRTSPVLSWEDVDDADYYVIYLGTNRSDYDDVIFATTTGTSSEVTRALLPKTKYYWRVDVVANKHTVRRSVRYSFTTDDRTEVSQAGTTNKSTWIHTITPSGEDSLARAYGFEEPYFTYAGIEAPLMKVHAAGDLIFLTAGVGSKLQRIGKRAYIEKHGTWHEVELSGIWPEENGYYIGKAYYILRPADPLYTTAGSYTATMDMTVPGCTGSECFTPGWRLQQFIK